MKKFFKSIFAILFIVPTLLIFTACGNSKSLDGNTYVFSKIEVTGTIVKEEAEKDYIYMSYSFDEDTVDFVDGSETDTYDYKFENKKVYIKAKTDTSFPDRAFGEISGKYFVKTLSLDDGDIKIYFKKK